MMEPPAQQDSEMDLREHQHTHAPQHKDGCYSHPPCNTPEEYDKLLSHPAVPKTASYMASLVPPSPEEFERIKRAQETKEEEIRQRDRQQHRQHRLESQSDHHERTEAARLIQKTFRGHRARRELDGFGLDASTRWISAIREAEFRETTRPRTREAHDNGPTPSYGGQGSGAVSNARVRWKKASVVARRAGHDDLESDSSSLTTTASNASVGEKERVRKKSEQILGTSKQKAQMMGLQYFLEMVDVKHRYGSNLRTYHAEWKRSNTRENFFYWLDFGEGRNVEVEACPRDRLDRERIRYLSREERQYYLVKVDDEGRLRWAKNDARIDTTDAYKDSIHGIVPADDPTPAYDPGTQPRHGSSLLRGSSSDSAASSARSRRRADREAKYLNPQGGDSDSADEHEDEEPDEHQHPRMRKVKHFSASTIWNKLLRRSVKEGTWIFVADTSFRMYVGIKNSGAFQHSSFLQGSRISAAGLIKIKDGRITSLSPLSGHYRPPASSFRSFVHSLREGGVDMSKVTISKSFAILVGLESYKRARKRSKHLLGKMTNRKEKLVHPEEFRQQEQEAMDTSKSAAREREVVAAEMEENKTTPRVMEKIGLPREHKGGD